MAVLRTRLQDMPLEELSLDDGEDTLEVFGGDMDTSLVQASGSPSASSDMSIDSEESVEPSIAPAATRFEPAPPNSPPPPPPPNEPPHPPSTPNSATSLPMTRWARYDTDLFDSERLMAFTTARPLPLGY